MEAEKSQDLQVASWRPRRADCVSSSLKTGRLAQEELMLQFESRGRKKTKALRQEALPLARERASLLCCSGL